MKAESPPQQLKTLLSVADVGHAAAVLDWLKGYISSPHPEIGRSGPVCPFVPLSLRSDQVRIVLHDELDGTDPGAIRALILAYVAEFNATAPASATARRQRSIVLALPAITAAREHVLAEIHEDVKSDVVREGAMLGQFYESCQETAARNPAFLVSTGPVPCFVIRHMAPHDVLFLHDRPDWFAQYHDRFAADFRAGRIHDPLLVRLFQQAETHLEKS
jgi:heptaprenyl diphosphate synthase